MRPARKRARRRGRLTLRDLAKHADVSPATVSLVLRKSPLVAQATRERVLELMRTLGYVYNRGAASLRTQRTHTVGVAINELANPYFAELTAAIEHALNRSAIRYFLSNSAEDPARQDQFIDTMREYNVDGLIICPAEGTTARSLRRLIQFEMPCVQISRYVRDVALDFAGNDHRRGTFLATNHLISLGHQRIAMIGGNARISTGWNAIKALPMRSPRTASRLDPDFAHLLPRRRAKTAPRRSRRSSRRVIHRPRPPATTMSSPSASCSACVSSALNRVMTSRSPDVTISSEAALWNPALDQCCDRHRGHWRSRGAIASGTHRGS